MEERYCIRLNIPNTYHQKDQKSTLKVNLEQKIIENYILKLLNSCTEYHLLLVGDFNSRTGNMDDFILIDNTISIPELFENSTYQTDDFQVPRSNSDTEINNYGKHLISICNSYGLQF